MKILVINAGSSSLKYQFIDMDNEQVIAKGNVESITNNPGELSHADAFQMVLDRLTDKETGVISSLDEIGAIGHRVLHGGERFTESVVIDDAVAAAIDENAKLAPLHNPYQLLCINVCRKMLPNTPMVVVFDTAFHQTMPPKAFIYGLPYEYYTRLKVRRYGFHGTSHRYVSARAIDMLGRGAKGTKIIVCHLGNGSSLSAVVDGKCVDTSMGITPLEGVLMGTRSGNIDPSIFEFIMQEDGLTAQQMMTVLNKKSGLEGVSGVSNDMRAVLKGAEEGNERCKLALDVWAYGIRKYIGSYAAAMGGVDAIAFTGGIGEHNPLCRAMILEGLEFMGVEFDPAKNEAAKDEADFSKDNSRVRTLLISTNEEIMIARDTLKLTAKK